MSEGNVVLAQPPGFCAGVRRAMGIVERALDLHGVRSAAAGRQLEVIDATRPLVSKVHQRAVRFARDGRTILLVGHEGHEEVEGVLGEAPDRIVVTSKGPG